MDVIAVLRKEYISEKIAIDILWNKETDIGKLNWIWYSAKKHFSIFEVCGAVQGGKTICHVLLELYNNSLTN